MKSGETANTNGPSDQRTQHESSDVTAHESLNTIFSLDFPQIQPTSFGTRIQRAISEQLSPRKKGQ